ncbi:unnamed protein product [Microthlaspi erraticum]|uniref:Arabidopsis retrotransposon Orf1 C-terminal domain-containing protein n=1 Tax=Microthlaspi erraticum TaxID=1685480 RepID=A0A6D2KS65_9BRAS|nr:unnamed protein product [Microthlaspi erraticum]
MWSFSRTCTWPSFLLSHGIYKELTCEFLASMRYHMYEEEDRADLDQGLGWITFLAKGEKRMVTFRQLGILFGFNYGEGTKWNFKEKELQRVWATIADGVYSSSRSKAAQIRSPVLEVCAQGTCQHLLCKEGHRDQSTRELKFLDMGIKPILSRTSDGKRIRGEIDHTGNLMPFLDISLPTRSQPTTLDINEGGAKCWRAHHPILCAAGVNPTDREPLNQVGWTSSFARPTFSLSTRSWMGGSNSSSHIHWLDLQASPA